MKLIFLHADKHESFLQIDTTVSDGGVQAFQKFPKVCDVFYNISKKQVRGENFRIFCMQINIKVS